MYSMTLPTDGKGGIKKEEDFTVSVHIFMPGTVPSKETTYVTIRSMKNLRYLL